MNDKTISVNIPALGGWVQLDRDKLETAYLVLTDMHNVPMIDRTEETANKLMEMGFDLNDAVIYSQSAMLCVLGGFEL